MSQDMTADEEGDEAQYEATKQAVEDTYECDDDHLFADGVLCGELNKGLYSRLERFEKEIKLARDDGNREFEIESIEAYIRTARKLDGVDVSEDTSDSEPVLMTDGGETAHPEPVTDENTLNDLISHHFVDCHDVVFHAAYDVQTDLQNHLDIGYEEVQIIGRNKDYIVVAGESLWSETEAGFRTDVWENHTTEAIVDSIRNLHIDLAKRAMYNDDLWDIIGVTDVAVVFTR